MTPNVFQERTCGMSILRSPLLRGILPRFWHVGRTWTPWLPVLALLSVLVRAVTPRCFGPPQATSTGVFCLPNRRGILALSGAARGAAVPGPRAAGAARVAAEIADELYDWLEQTEDEVDRMADQIEAMRALLEEAADLLDGTGDPQSRGGHRFVPGMPLEHVLYHLRLGCPVCCCLHRDAPFTGSDCSLPKAGYQIAASESSCTF